MTRKRIIRSKPGLFGITYHYEDGKYIGKSRSALLGDRKVHYNTKGRKTGTSIPGLLADEIHYDRNGKRFISSYSDLTGEVHISNGSPIGKSVPGIISGSYTSINDDCLMEGDNLNNECLDLTDDWCDYDEEDKFNAMESNIGCDEIQNKAPRIIRKVIGILFVLVTLLLIALMISFAVKRENIAPGIAACIMSGMIAFFCLRSTK